MSAPSPVTRAVLLERDEHRCIVCAVTVQLEAQHRRRVGMGGSALKPKIADLVTACSKHNNAFEAELQAEALQYGWKVRSWVAAPEMVPVYDFREQRWYRLTIEGVRFPITPRVALKMMHDVYGDAYVPGVGLTT